MSETEETGKSKGQSERKNKNESRNEREFSNEPSSLDDNTHAEMRLLYDESAETIRFAKRFQWWTVGSTLLVFAGIVALTKIIPHHEKFAHNMVGAVIVLAMGCVLTLVIHQSWQHTEMAKIDEIEKNFSTLFARVRGIKSRREANIHRYLLLLFMIVTVVIGAVFTYLAMHQFVLYK